MKISELLSKLDFSKKEKYRISEEFLNEFDLDSHDVDINSINLECIRIVMWYCTDAWVGNSVLLLNDLPVCISTKIGRKWDEEFEWVSRDIYYKTKTFIENAKIKNDKSINVLNIEKELSGYYKIEFASQLISHVHTVAFYNGKKVSVRKPNSFNYTHQKIEIIFEDGKSEMINITDLKFPLLGLKGTGRNESL